MVFKNFACVLSLLAFTILFNSSASYAIELNQKSYKVIGASNSTAQEINDSLVDKENAIQIITESININSQADLSKYKDANGNLTINTQGNVIINFSDFSLTGNETIAFNANGFSSALGNVVGGSVTNISSSNISSFTLTNSFDLSTLTINPDTLASFLDKDGNLIVADYIKNVILVGDFNIAGNLTIATSASVDLSKAKLNVGGTLLIGTIGSGDIIAAQSLSVGAASFGGIASTGFGASISSTSQVFISLSSDIDSGSLSGPYPIVLPQVKEEKADQKAKESVFVQERRIKEERDQENEDLDKKLRGSKPKRR